MRLKRLNRHAGDLSCFGLVEAWDDGARSELILPREEAEDHFSFLYAGVGFLRGGG